MLLDDLTRQMLLLASPVCMMDPPYGGHWEHHQEQEHPNEQRADEDSERDKKHLDTEESEEVPRRMDTNDDEERPRLHPNVPENDPNHEGRNELPCEG